MKRGAAEAGHTDAAFNLGGAYVNGLGVDKDLTQAYRWLTIAANGGDQDSAKARTRLASRMSPQELDKARALAASWTACKTKAECEAQAAR